MSIANGSTTTLLDPLGLSEVEEKTYRILLRRGGGSRPDVVRWTGVSERSARAALESLEQRGLLGRSVSRPNLYIAAPPQAAVDLLILRRQEDLERARLATRQLLAEAGSEVSGVSSSEILEVISGDEAVASRNYQLLMGAQHEVLGFAVPPLDSPDERFTNFKLEMLGRGVKARVIYTPKALEVPGMMTFIETLRPFGEEPRVAAQLPMYLLIVDRDTAFMPARLDGAGQQHDHLVVHPGALLDLLLAQFESAWQRAAPFERNAAVPANDHLAAGQDELVLSTEESRVLALLGAGMHDAAIAAQLGIGARSVQRHIRRVQDLLGTSSRFQTGMEAGRRGLVGQSRDPAAPTSP